MMNYSEFTKYAEKHIKDHLPPEYQAADIRIDTVRKTNEQYTGMTIRTEQDGSSPVINMEMFYQQYQDGRDMQDIMQDMAGIALMPLPASIDIEALKDYENVKDKLFVRLSSVEGNEEIMAGSPHHMAADMMMTYHIHIPEMNGEGFMSARVTNEMLKDFGITPEQLHQDAIASTAHIFEPKVQGMMEAITGIPEEEPHMLVVTNSIGTLGASALFCEGVMDQVAEKMNGDYFVLPSSQHELLAVPDNGDFSRADLEKMVREANRTVVDAPDRLSDEVYHYDQKDRVFERADAFEKRTQVKAAEKESLLGKLQNKKEQIERTNPAIGVDKHRQTGLAI